jgi:hypothetical protein
MKLYTPWPLLLKFYRRFRPAFILLFLFVILLSQGCFQHYYKTNTAYSVRADTLKKMVNEGKYFILHDATHAFALTHIQVNDSSIDGNLDSVLTAHEGHLHPSKPTRNRFPAYNKDFVLNEVHIYTKTPFNDASQVQIPLGNINRIDIYALDKGITNASKIGSILGIAGVTAIATVLILYAADPWKK